MLRIYGSARSRGVRTLWMVGELGLQYEHLDYLPRSPATRTPEYLALNPNGRVPTIDDDGFVLSESMAINLYLAKRHGRLYPTDPKNEALAWQWSFWETDRLDRQLTTYANNAFVLPEAQRNADAAKGAWGEIAAALDVLEIALGRSRWLAGDEFSIADLNVAAAMVRALSFDLGKWPKVHAWLQACWDRPAAKRALAMRA
ncbi:MAG TPA: glutathione S-transferase family protein [Acetobacteraceae bacterium]|nr:glutathione S-transferase family protein [Acetobacteraceae bacterium]